MVICLLNESSESKITPRLRAAGVMLAERGPSCEWKEMVELGGPKRIISDFDSFNCRKFCVIQYLMSVRHAKRGDMLSEPDVSGMYSWVSSA